MTTFVSFSAPQKVKFAECLTSAIWNLYQSDVIVSLITYVMTKISYSRFCTDQNKTDQILHLATDGR